MQDRGADEDATLAEVEAAIRSYAALRGWTREDFRRRVLESFDLEDLLFAAGHLPDPAPYHLLAMAYAVLDRPEAARRMWLQGQKIARNSVQ